MLRRAVAEELCVTVLASPLSNDKFSPGLPREPPSEPDETRLTRTHAHVWSGASLELCVQKCFIDYSMLHPDLHTWRTTHGSTRHCGHRASSTDRAALEWWNGAASHRTNDARAQREPRRARAHQEAYRPLASPSPKLSRPEEPTDRAGQRNGAATTLSLLRSLRVRHTAESCCRVLLRSRSAWE